MKTPAEIHLKFSGNYPNKRAPYLSLGYVVSGMCCGTATHWTFFQPCLQEMVLACLNRGYPNVMGSIFWRE